MNKLAGLIKKRNARILGGGMFGEMRGKLGSMVFARNRAGAYSRFYAKPVDPATVAQLAARNAFGNASSNYHSLDSTTKALWQNFANTVFNPKTGTAGVPSGFNAFVSLLNAVNNAIESSTAISVGGTPEPITETGYVFSAIPANFALEPNLKLSTGGVANLNFIDATISSITPSGLTWSIESVFQMSANLSVGTTGNIGLFEDANDNAFGFKVFMSNPVDQPGMFVQNPYMQTIGQTKISTLTTPAALDSPIQITLTTTMDTTDFSALPVPGQYVQLSVFLVGVSGMMFRFGNYWAEVPAFT